jgi:ubiquinone/menaquinone biosynthesis C-methylase UbiE
LADEAAARIRRQELDRRIVCQVGRLDALPFGDGSIDLLVGVGPVLIWGDRQKKIAEIYRVLRPGGAALVGGRYLGMPESRKVSSEVLRADVDATGIPGIRVFEDRGQWVEVLQGPGR